MGVVLKSPQGERVVLEVRCEFNATNNESEYEALIFGLTLEKDIGIKKLEVFCDSQLVVYQFSGEYVARDERMIAYLAIVKTLVEQFDAFNVQQIPRELNTHADVLANLGSTLEPMEFPSIPLVHILIPAITPVANHECAATRSQTTTWTTTFIKWFEENQLPSDKGEGKKLKVKATRYCMMD